MPLRTFQNYEQDKREPDLRTLAALHERGWNLNWVLMGEGPEQLDTAAGAASGQLEGAGDDSCRNSPIQSQDLNQDRLILAMQAVDDALATRNAFLPAAKRAEAVMLVYELLGSGLPEAEVIPLARRAVGLAQGGAVDGKSRAAATGR
ncbi:MAG: hypothetical protein ACREPD_14300 [Stenotrophomonas sp.]|uniref:hypothetical protein n=1 Tax=Stenotrophomonas sp. TaxID=69392 RepID=UPI003D6CCD40